MPHWRRKVSTLRVAKARTPRRLPVATTSSRTTVSHGDSAEGTPSNRRVRANDGTLHRDKIDLAYYYIGKYITRPLFSFVEWVFLAGALGYIAATVHNVSPLSRTVVNLLSIAAYIGLIFAVIRNIYVFYDILAEALLPENQSWRIFLGLIMVASMMATFIVVLISLGDIVAAIASAGGKPTP